MLLLASLDVTTDESVCYQFLWLNNPNPYTWKVVTAVNTSIDCQTQKQAQVDKLIISLSSTLLLWL